MTPPARATAGRQVAVVGAGWAGLAAAVEAVQQGLQPTLFDTAAQAGGRARSLPHENRWLDNGQHILIGAYHETLQLMRTVGVDLQQALLRRPLELVYPDGLGLRLPRAHPLPSFVLGVWRHPAWPMAARWALLRSAAGWLAGGFRCHPELTVHQLTSHLPAVLRDDLVDPLCVAALNTPAQQASAAVFLRVLKDALFSGAGSADLLLPRVPLQALLPDPAVHWLGSRGVPLRLGHRVQAVQRDGDGWRVDGQRFDAVLLACSAGEAARLVRPLAPAWAAPVAGFAYEPIVTVTLHAAGARLPLPMVALRAQPGHPAQFAFDLGQLGPHRHHFAFVISGARDWVDRGLAHCADAVVAQAQAAFPPGTWPSGVQVVKVIAEKRATFACAPNLQRPPAQVLPGLVAAGDYVQGPYPATLEGAVRSGRAAVAALAAG